MRNKTLSTSLSIARCVVKMRPMDDGWGVTSQGTIHRCTNNYLMYKTHISKYQQHAKWLMGPLYYAGLLPHNTTQRIMSHILHAIITMLWLAYSVIVQYSYVDPGKIGADYCSEDLAKFGFISVWSMIILNGGITTQLWLFLWYNQGFQEICFNEHVCERILDEPQKAKDAQLSKSRFIMNMMMLLPVSFLVTDMLANSPFNAEHYNDYHSWAIFGGFIVLTYAGSIPNFCIVNTFWYYTSFLCVYCESATSKIDSLNDGDSIVNLYKQVRTFTEIASDNYKILCVFFVLSHVLDFFLTVIYFAQCTNPNNYLLMVLLVMCSMMFVMPLVFMSLVTKRLKDFEKKVLYKLDEFGSVRTGFTTYILSMPIGYRFATDDIIIYKSTVFKIVNVILTVLIGVYRSIMTVQQQ
eukprot:242559_1